MMSQNLEEVMYVRQDDILSVEIDDELLIMADTDCDKMMGLNATAKFLWDQLESPKTLNQLMSALANIYDTTEEQCKSDTEKFLTEANLRQIITQIGNKEK